MDKQQHWTGALLLMKGLLFQIYAFNVLQGSGVILLSRAIASGVLMAYGWFSGGIYKQWPFDALKISFLLNLTILSSASLYVHYMGGKKGALIYISIAIALLEFVGIVIIQYNMHT